LCSFVFICGQSTVVTKSADSTASPLDASPAAPPPACPACPPPPSAACSTRTPPQNCRTASPHPNAPAVAHRSAPRPKTAAPSPAPSPAPHPARKCHTSSHARTQSTTCSPPRPGSPRPAAGTSALHAAHPPAPLPVGSPRLPPPSTGLFAPASTPHPPSP